MSKLEVTPNDSMEQRRRYEPAEDTRLRLAVAAAKERLAPFEQRYGVSSEYFMAEMAAEDLEGGDDEYVQWAGEWRLLKRLEEKSTQ